MKRGVVWIGLALAATPWAGAADVSGVVKFEGERPKRQPITQIAANSFCKEACAGKEVLSDKFVYGKNGEFDTLANVLVYVSKGLEGKTFAPPQEPVIVDQVNCIYSPHVVAAMKGQTVEIRNSDATLHNVMTQPKKNRGFNDGMPGTGRKLEKVFDKPELGINLRCFMHPWMSGYVHVLEHPFYAITGTNGTFQIKGLPPGEYELSVYHEFSRFISDPATISIKVAESDVQHVQFVYHARTD